MTKVDEMAAMMDAMVWKKAADSAASTAAPMVAPKVLVLVDW